MAAFQGFRVSADYAAAAPEGLHCAQTARGLNAGHSALDSPLLHWNGFSDGIDFNDSSYSKKSTACYPIFWTRIENLKAALVFYTEILTLKQPILTQTCQDALPSANALYRPSKFVCVHGKDRRMVYMLHLGKAMIRSDGPGMIAIDRVEDQAGGRNMDLDPQCSGFSLLLAAQIWSSFTLTQRFYRGFTVPLTADPRWGKNHLEQKISSHQPPPMRQEVKNSRDSGPMLPQKSSEDSSAPFQIQIAQISGKTIMQWVKPTDLVQNLKANLEYRLGIPSALQRLIFQGKQLEDPLSLSSYSIRSNSSLVFSFRLRGGAAGQSSSAPPNSYKDAVHPEMPATPEPPKPKPFLVDKLEEVPSVAISFSDLADHTQQFAERALICRFNGLWPRSKDLYDWIKDNWSDRCKVHFCAKGYFIVLFDDLEHYDNALEEGPWFMGSAGLFLTPWFPDFDPASAVITKAPVWIRLPNLPIHLWRTEVYRQIGNALGSFVMGDYQRERQGLYTYARVCVELDLSKGLPEYINLKINDFVWTQFLDYENTTFRCRHCHLTGHLHISCPSLTARTKKGNAAHSKPKRWAPCPPPTTGSSSSPSMKKEESKSVPDQTPRQMEPPTIIAGHTQVTTISQKRPHETSSSDSEKESPKVENSSLQVVLAHSPHDGWTKVNKKKGKKPCGVVTGPLG